VALSADLRDLDRAAGAAADLVRVAVEDVPGAAADRADPQQTPTRIGFTLLLGVIRPFLNMSLMPRTAWRKRCSFSIRAMRTWSSP